VANNYNHNHLTDRLFYYGRRLTVILLIASLPAVSSNVLACEPDLALNCPPSADGQVYVDNLSVQINGGISTPPPCEPVTRMSWDWGDGNVNDSWFPASHSYTAYDDYLVTVSALDASDNLLVSQSCNVKVSMPDLIFSDGLECGDIPGNCRPTFDGMTFLSATAEDEVTIAWFPAKDDDTSAENIQYDIYLSMDEYFQPGPSSLKVSLLGQLSTVVPGLVPGSRYYALVVARDQSGQGSVERDHLSVSTPAFPFVPSSTPMQRAVDLNLGTPVSADETTLTFSSGNDAIPPNVGAVLIGPLAGGKGYIRMVESVTERSGEFIVTTRMSTPDEIFDQLHLSTVGVLSEGDSATSVPSTTMTGAKAVFNTQVFTQQDGSRVTRSEWEDGLLIIERVDYAGSAGPITFGPGIEAASHMIGTKGYDYGELKLDLTLDFKPEMVSEAKWDVFSLKEAEILARGEMLLKAFAGYEFSVGKGIHPDPFRLFKITWTAIYTLGPVPVYQQIELAVDVQVDFEATTEVKASTTAEAKVTAEVGATYNEANGWEHVSNLNSSTSFSADLGVSGSVTGSIRLIPSLTLEFYETAAAILSIEPSLNGALEAELTLEPLCAPLELTKLESDIKVDCHAKFEWWHIELLDVKLCDIAPKKLFSLPTLDFSARGYGPISLTGVVKDGVNNKFIPSSIEWGLKSATGSLDPTTGSATTLTCPEGGNHKVTFSGYGELGPLSRQCIQKDMSCNLACPGGTDEECLPGQICHNETCRSSCGDETSCSVGQTCDAGGLCRNDCKSDDDCSNGEICNFTGYNDPSYCVDSDGQVCSSFDDCPYGQTCYGDELVCGPYGRNTGMSCFQCRYQWGTTGYTACTFHVRNGAQCEELRDISNCPPHPYADTPRTNQWCSFGLDYCTGHDCLDPDW